MMKIEDRHLFDELVEMANRVSDGHLTIYKFTTNWRISFETPSSRTDIDEAAEGKTFAEAAEDAMQRVRVRESGW